MKFLYLCADHGIPVLGAKGASVHVREFVTALMNQGHSVRLICANQGQGNPIGSLLLTEIRPEAGTAQHEAALAGLRAQNPSFLPSESLQPKAAQLLNTELEKWEFNTRLEPALERIIAEEQPDVLYERYSLFSNAGTIAARKCHLPHLLEVNAPLIQERQASVGMILIEVAKQIEDQVLSETDAVIPVSAVLRDYVIGRGAHPGRVTVIPNGVDLDKFSPTIGENESKSARLQRLGLAAELQDRTVIGFVGSLKPWHGVDILIQAFARVHRLNPQLFLLIIGEGPQLEKLRSEARAQSVSDHIYFTGAVPHELIPQYVALLDIAVAPYRRQASFYFSPLKILEYLAAGRPVIATRQGQISELIEHERNGLLCEADSVESLADALNRLAQDGELQRQLAQQAVGSVAENHSWSDVARRVVALATALKLDTAGCSPGPTGSTSQVSPSQRVP